MKGKKQKIEPLIAQLELLIDQAKKYEERYTDELKKVHPAFRDSARNLLHYRAFRSVDVRDLQKKLEYIGFSRLARIDNHVMASLLTSRSILRMLAGLKPSRTRKTPVSIKRGEKLLRTHSKDLLGYRSKGRRVRIMVTLPGEAATDYQLVHDLIASGMNSARINCAHDDHEAWKAMIDHVRTACKKLRRNVKVCMDLGGPKIRTGSMLPGPKVISFSPERDSLGHVIRPAVVWLAPVGVPPPDGTSSHIPIPADWKHQIHVGDSLHFDDTRGKWRTLTVEEETDAGLWAITYDRAYVVTGTLLHLNNRESDGVPVGEIPPVEQNIILNSGDLLILHKANIPGEPAEYDQNGNLLKTAHISCTAREVFDRVIPGERVLLDDGKIVGVIEMVIPGEEIRVRVTYARQGGQKLAADKGINFPDSDLNIRGLTEKDREDLAFVAGYADVVNMSFVNSPDDVRDLLEEMRKLDALGKLGIILKIETQNGFRNMTEILLTGMQTYPVGVMIARGDLAIEVGWEHMARIQEEILSLCLAAHVPDIWATQVLETLAKKGLPSRAEITDAAMAQRAECVMLNKGPYILQAIQMLDHILQNMKDYQFKKTPMLPPIDTETKSTVSG